MGKRGRRRGPPDNTIPVDPSDIGEGGSKRKRLRRYNEADRKRRARQPIDDSRWARTRDRTCPACGKPVTPADQPRGPEKPCRRCLFGPPPRVRFIPGGAPGMGKRR